MTNDEIRIAVAEANGWKWFRLLAPADRERLRTLYHVVLHRDYVATLEYADMTERQCHPTYMWLNGMIPDYPSDLNAIHDTVQSLGVPLPEEFKRQLRMVTLRDAAYGTDLEDRLSLATAHQHCEAFLRFKKLWKD